MDIKALFKTDTPIEALEKLSGKPAPKIEKICLSFPDRICEKCGKKNAYTFPMTDHVETSIMNAFGLDGQIMRYRHFCSTECWALWMVWYYGIPLTPQQKIWQRTGKKLQQKLRQIFRPTKSWWKNNISKPTKRIREFYRGYKTHYKFLNKGGKTNEFFVKYIDASFFEPIFNRNLKSQFPNGLLYIALVNTEPSENNYFGVASRFLINPENIFFEDIASKIIKAEPNKKLRFTKKIEFLWQLGAVPFYENVKVKISIPLNKKLEIVLKKKQYIKEVEFGKFVSIEKAYDKNVQLPIDEKGRKYMPNEITVKWKPTVSGGLFSEEFKEFLMAAKRLAEIEEQNELEQLAGIKVSEESYPPRTLFIIDWKEWWNKNKPIKI